MKDTTQKWPDEKESQGKVLGVQSSTCVPPAQV